MKNLSRNRGNDENKFPVAAPWANIATIPAKANPGIARASGTGWRLPGFVTSTHGLPPISNGFRLRPPPE